MVLRNSVIVLCGMLCVRALGGWFLLYTIFRQIVDSQSELHKGINTDETQEKMRFPPVVTVHFHSRWHTPYFYVGFGGFFFSGSGNFGHDFFLRRKLEREAFYMRTLVFCPFFHGARVMV